MRARIIIITTPEEHKMHGSTKCNLIFPAYYTAPKMNTVNTDLSLFYCFRDRILTDFHVMDNSYYSEIFEC